MCVCVCACVEDHNKSAKRVVDPNMSPWQRLQTEIIGTVTVNFFFFVSQNPRSTKIKVTKWVYLQNIPQTIAAQTTREKRNVPRQERSLFYELSLVARSVDVLWFYYLFDMSKYNNSIRIHVSLWRALRRNDLCHNCKHGVGK